MYKKRCPSFKTQLNEEKHKKNGAQAFKRKQLEETIADLNDKNKNISNPKIHNFNIIVIFLVGWAAWAKPY